MLGRCEGERNEQSELVLQFTFDLLPLTFCLFSTERENETGTIEPGKSADFIVINQNLLEIPPEKIHETKVLRTVLRGHTVYQGK